MSAAHLHAIPDPGDIPAPVTVTRAPGEEAEDGRATEAGDGLEGLDDAQEPGEEDVPRRVFALPDLRPYVTADRSTAKEFSSLAADITRATAPRVRRGIAPVLHCLWWLLRTGTIVPLLVAQGWFSGELAPKVPPLWRLLVCPLVAVAGVVQTVAVYPWSPLVLVAVWPPVAVAARQWAIGKVDQAEEAEDSDKVGKAPAKDTGKASQKGKGKGRKATPKHLAERLAEVLARPLTGPSPEASAEAFPEAPAEASAEPAQDPTTEPRAEAAETLRQEAPPAPSRDAIVRALHALAGDSSGVLDTALRDHLRYPSTRAVREALAKAGITHRSGVRAVGGNGPGVHRADFPPLPPSREESPGADVVAGQSANNNNANSGEEPREGFRVVRNDHGGVTIYDLSNTHYYRAD